MSNNKFILTLMILLALTAANLRAQNDDGSWKLFTDSAKGVSFRYPETLETKYINTRIWPPEVQVLNESFTCGETNPGDDGMLKTEQRIINDNTYCVTEKSEGAAGTVYIQYTYAFLKFGRVVNLNFVLGFVQCGNYDNPEKSECEKERRKFNIDKIIDLIAQTLVIEKG
ncbi:MAG: hypothetical protein ABSF32_07545 [Ignavibacteria bacterium]|jgi:hypothetical protein